MLEILVVRRMLDFGCWMMCGILLRMLQDGGIGIECCIGGGLLFGLSSWW